MTSAEWEMTVPADESELAAEFRRRGVRPGARLHVVVSDEPADTHGDLPTYFGSFTGPADLAVRSEEILRTEFPAATS
jgi:hypothetical protein